ncbi:MAG: sugar ABC transporter permease [Chloroflexota bacterium]|nr:sugar ABC transporter permease [Chloroflexota bacterium]
MVAVNRTNAVPGDPPRRTFAERLDDAAPHVLLLPAVLIVLVFALFPLFVSIVLSFSRFQFVRGGFQITWVGFANYNKLFFGSEQRHLLGKFTPLDQLSLPAWIVFAAFVVVMLVLFYQYVTSPRRRVFGMIMRVITMIIAGSLALMAVATLTGIGIPGTLTVTLLIVFGAVALEYAIGFGLALLLTQNLRGKRFFRVLFLLPMMITPVGVGFLFRMLTNTTVGPLEFIWVGLGLQNFSMLDTAHSARLAVIVGDVWQWTPFMFIILLAALEGVSKETVEAALVDGANGWQLFRYIVLPDVIPVSTTVILIRMIEAFKILDIPNVLTGGGPGTATETLTLHSFYSWRALDLGISSAVAYILLFVVTFMAMVFVNIVRRRVLEAFA